MSSPPGYLDKARRHLWAQIMMPERMADPDAGLLFLDRGEGVWVWDTDGRRYLDALSGIYTVAVGHGRKEIVDAATRQMQRLAFVNPIGCTTEITVDLAAKLAAIARGVSEQSSDPGAEIDKAYLVSSGSEAVDIALRLAKQYHYNRGERKRHKVIARMGSYHGHTFGSLSVNFAPFSARARPAQEPMAHGAIAVPGIDCFQCPYEKTYPACDVFCARVIERFIEAERPETIAALIAEPISTSAGGQVPPPEYWRALRQLCDRHGILLIADEVTNGIGRTGTWFAIERFGVAPDMIAIAKGLTSGYAPLGAVLASRRVHEAFVGDASRLFIAAHTFGGHPVACAAALANIEIIEREGLLSNAVAMGERLLSKLCAVVERRRVGGEARGVGLQCSLQLVKGKAPLRMFGPADRIGDRLSALLRKRGILARATDRIELAPPLCIGPAEVDLLASAVDDALAELEGACG